MYRTFLIISAIVVFNSYVFSQNQSKDKSEDELTAIALQPFYSDKELLKESAPRKLPNIYLNSSEYDTDIEFGERDPMDTAEELNLEIERLKNHYKKFLKNNNPIFNNSRHVVFLEDFQYRKETTSDKKNFDDVLTGKGVWEQINIPHYVGPIGTWTAYYRKEIEISKELKQYDALFLNFQAVDYIAKVYLNGQMIKFHEGFFAPFEVDITDYLNDGSNSLVIQVKNEVPQKSSKSHIDTLKFFGHKVFGGTGLGWDEPGYGWHHCPPGAGIWQEVTLEGRNTIHISDIFIRPDIDNNQFEIWASIWSADAGYVRNIELSLDILPRNFEGEYIKNVIIPTEKPVHPGMNQYRAVIPIRNFKLWSPETPYLYDVRVYVKDIKSQKTDIAQQHFGMRKFHMSDTGVVKGKFYLNNEQMFLRGANTMGHLQLAEMRNDTNQLIEDILIAKAANINFYRMTQRPVQKEIYNMFDHLGMMAQTDLPSFGYIRRSMLMENLEQVADMEKLVRNHPSNIMVTYINEPYLYTWGPWKQMHVHLTREELHRFFEAAREITLTLNPDRVIKPADGDFMAPAPYGLPDHHLYNTWYGNNHLPIGKLNHGYWYPVQPDWMSGCGEFGAEGLDYVETMLKHYPDRWLPEVKSANEEWHPKQMTTFGHRAQQTSYMHPRWIDRQETMQQWVDASHNHQAWAARIQTRAFRRMSERISSFAIHLLIDAYPAGWMKSLVDVDRNAKPAYFEYADALSPLLCDIQLDRRRYFSGEKLDAQFWLCNDQSSQDQKGLIVYEVWKDKERIFAHSIETEIPSLKAEFKGFFDYTLPDVEERTNITIKLGVKNFKGDLLHDTEEEITLFPEYQLNTDDVVFIAGQIQGKAWKMVETMGATPRLLRKGDIVLKHPIIIEGTEYYKSYYNILEDALNKGTNVLFLELPSDSVYTIFGERIQINKIKNNWFLSRKTGHKMVNSFKPFDFFLLYNKELGYADDNAANSNIEGDNIAPVLYIHEKNGSSGLLPVIGEMRFGTSKVYLCQVHLDRFLESEPPLQELIINILRQ